MNYFLFPIIAKCHLKKSNVLRGSSKKDLEDSFKWWKLKTIKNSCVSNLLFCYKYLMYLFIQCVMIFLKMKNDICVSRLKEKFVQLQGLKITEKRLGNLKCYFSKNLQSLLVLISDTLFQARYLRQRLPTITPDLNFCTWHF